MINRRLIRVKVVQILYSYYQSGKNSLDLADKELLLSFEKTHDLYHLFLLLILQVKNFSLERLEMKQKRLLASDEDLNPNRRFVDNRFTSQLEANVALKRFAEIEGDVWGEHRTLLLELWGEIEVSDVYKSYMNAKETDYNEDKRLWVWIVRHVFTQNENLGHLIEELNIYWNDDAEMVLSFVEKTIKRFTESEGASHSLLPLFLNEEDRDYARTLLHESILKDREFRSMIAEVAQNWDMERVALMDMVTMQVALAEMSKFQNIPMKVSLNEYIDIVKSYSTSKSALFVNGILDTLGKRIRTLPS